MYIIFLMTGDAIRRQFHFRRRLAMTIGALEFCMGTKQSEASLLEVVVFPQCPTVGVVTTVAFSTQSALVYVVLLMAIEALGLCITERLRAVALSATHHVM